jgi:hypothetical protein
MKEVLWIDPIRTEPGLIAYECPSCSYITSVLTPSTGGMSTSEQKCIGQQALSMGLFGYFAGLALVLTFQPYFPRRLVLDPESIAIVFVITVAMCLAASTLGIRLALKVDPAAALAAAG